MSSAIRRGGIPGPESRTALSRPSMTEAEFERRIGTQTAAVSISSVSEPTDANLAVELETAPRSVAGQFLQDAGHTHQASQTKAGPAHVCDRRGPGQEALALRYPSG